MSSFESNSWILESSSHTCTRGVAQKTHRRDDDEDMRSNNEEHVGLSASVTPNTDLSSCASEERKKKESADDCRQKFVNILRCV